MLVHRAESLEEAQPPGAKKKPSFKQRLKRRVRVSRKLIKRGVKRGVKKLRTGVSNTRKKADSYAKSKMRSNASRAGGAVKRGLRRAVYGREDLALPESFQMPHQTLLLDGEFDIEVFRRKFAALNEMEVEIRLPEGPLEYRLEGRSSFRVVEPFVTRYRSQLAEKLIELSEELQHLAEDNGGHQAIQLYARSSDTHTEELIAFYKYSPAQEAWVKLSGVDFVFGEDIDHNVIVETLRLIEKHDDEDELNEPNDPNDPEVDDDPQDTDDPEARRRMGEAKKKAPARADADDDEGEEEPEEPEKAPSDERPTKPGKKTPSKAPPKGDDDDGASTKSPPSSSGGQTQGPVGKDNGDVAPPPKNKGFKNAPKGVMGMDKDKDGFAKHGQRQTLPTTVMGASKVAPWRQAYMRLVGD